MLFFLYYTKNNILPDVAYFSKALYATKFQDCVLNDASVPSVSLVCITDNKEFENTKV
jgi:hypothetical protein